MKRKWRIPLSLHVYIFAEEAIENNYSMHGLRNFIRDSAIHDHDFDQHVPSTRHVDDVVVGDCSSTRQMS
jgi:hypothetical protein